MRRALLVAWLAVGAGCVHHPGLAQQSLMQGDLLLVKKDYPGAIDEYDRAVADDPYLRDAFLHRGVAYRHTGEFERALADFDHAIRLDKDYGRAYAERARAKLEWLAARANGDRAQLAEAFGGADPYGLTADLDRAVSLTVFTGDGTALLLRGAVRLMRQQDAEAQQDFDMFLRRRPKAQADLEDAIAKWKQERPVFDPAPLDELSKMGVRKGQAPPLPGAANTAYPPSQGYPFPTPRR
jgi:tetratricopeptide (TPR) repeat protein